MAPASSVTVNGRTGIVQYYWRTCHLPPAIGGDTAVSIARAAAIELDGGPGEERLIGTGVGHERGVDGAEILRGAAYSVPSCHRTLLLPTGSTYTLFTVPFCPAVRLFSVRAGAQPKRRS
jgi:hypothetical protein